MGVSFYTCKACGTTFPDCGSYVSCSEDGNGCGARFCSPECAQKDDPELDPDEIDWEKYEALSEEEQKPYRTTCSACRGDLENAENLLAFALTCLELSHSELVIKYREYRKSKA